MIVEKILVKNKRVILNGEYDIHIDTFLEFNFDEGDDIDIEQVMLSSQKKDAIEKGMRFSIYKMRTSKEVQKKLQSLGYSSDVITYALDKLLEYNYLDDYKYARMYIESKQGKNGTLYIKNKLREKGISDYIIRDIDIEESIEDIKEILVSKYGNLVEVSYEKKCKMIRFLSSRGFLMSNILDAVESYIREIKE